MGTTISTQTNVTLRINQRVITTILHRVGTIVNVPEGTKIERNDSVLVRFDDGQVGYLRPSHLNNYSDN